MNYFIYNSHHFTPHGKIWTNWLTSLPMCGFIAQLVEHRTGIAEVTGSNPFEALIFFQASSFQLLKLENLLRRSFFTFMYNPQYKYELFHIYFTSNFFNIRIQHCFNILTWVRIMTEFYKWNQELKINVAGWQNLETGIVCGHSLRLSTQLFNTLGFARSLPPSLPALSPLPPSLTYLFPLLISVFLLIQVFYASWADDRSRGQHVGNWPSHAPG